MSKLWEGRFSKTLDSHADDFNSSISVDSRMYKQDITGSMAHAAMLAAQGIIAEQDADAIIAELEAILQDIENGSLPIDTAAEDIHMFVETELTKRIGDVGKKLHTARSRNDQVAVDIRMYLREQIVEIQQKVKNLVEVLADLAQQNADAIMPGYTHLQRAQPILFAHHILAYAMMLTRDVGRLEDARIRMNKSPLGACALAGTTYPTDRYKTAKALSFDGICQNSIDAVSDRDFCVELLSALSVLMMHLSRFSEELILWCSWEFQFIELDDSFTTGSSIMPQKKNADIAELVRGKTGRVYGDLMGTLTMLKGLPLAYNKDMQEDKESVFDAVDTVKMCLDVFTPMVQTVRVKKENMYSAAQKGFINATDLADYLTKKGVPFRTAYKISGQLVGWCIQNGTVLEELPLSYLQQQHPAFGEDVYNEISLETCVAKRISDGGTSPHSVAAQIQFLREWLEGSV
ncbi:MAG: argininosuccinate lyase [Oscillospiraceae bacterium]|nr:argininosuccinate lyase [Oscillospiraceae bacterium]